MIYKVFHVGYVLALLISIISSSILARSMWRTLVENRISHIVFMIGITDIIWSALRLEFYCKRLHVGIHEVDELQQFYGGRQNFSQLSMGDSFVLVTSSTFIIASALWALNLSWVMFRLFLDAVNSPAQVYHFYIWTFCFIHWLVTCIFIIRNNGFERNLFWIFVPENCVQIVATLGALVIIILLKLENRQNYDWNPLSVIVSNRIQKTLIAFTCCITPTIIINLLYLSVYSVPNDYLNGISTLLFCLYGFVNTIIYGVDQICCLRCLRYFWIEQQQLQLDISIIEDTLHGGSYVSSIPIVKNMQPSHSTVTSYRSSFDTEVEKLIHLSTNNYKQEIKQDISYPIIFSTFVVTDVQGSTNLWQKFPSDMRLAQETHDHQLRTLLSKFKGYEFATEGDSFLVAFHHPVNALQWCIAVQLSLNSTVWPESLCSETQGNVMQGLIVRMGVYQGDDQIVRQSSMTTLRYTGKSFQVTKAISDAAHGGQIVCTEDIILGIEKKVLILDDPTILDLGYHFVQDAGDTPLHLFEIRPQSLANRQFAEIRTLARLNIDTINEHHHKPFK